MAGCCNSRGCDRFFGSRFAARVAKRYRRRGLDKPSRRMVEFIEGHGVEGLTVLEVGGGIGEIQLELLRRGAARTVNLELSSAYEHEAMELLRREFRTFAHPPAAMLAVLEERGLRRSFRHRGIPWQVAGLER